MLETFGADLFFAAFLAGAFAADFTAFFAGDFFTAFLLAAFLVATVFLLLERKKLTPNKRLYGPGTANCD